MTAANFYFYKVKVDVCVCVCVWRSCECMCVCILYVFCAPEQAHAAGLIFSYRKIINWSALF